MPSIMHPPFKILDPLLVNKGQKIKQISSISPTYMAIAKAKGKD